MIRRLVSSAAVASITLLALAGTVSAHVDPDPTEAQAGSRLTVGFTVEHGCEGSPTTQIDMRLADGVLDAVAEPIEGWVGSITTDIDTGADVVTFVGGPLPDDVAGTFEVTMTLPDAAGTTIYFPFVQRCEVGEIRWIGIPSEPDAEPAEPAPAMSLTGSAPAETDATAPTSTIVSASDSTASPSGGDTAGSSSTGTVIFIVSIAAVLVIGAIVVYRSRQTRAGHDRGPDRGPDPSS